MNWKHTLTCLCLSIELYDEIATFLDWIDLVIFKVYNHQRPNQLPQLKPYIPSLWPCLYVKHKTFHCKVTLYNTSFTKMINNDIFVWNQSKWCEFECSLVQFVFDSCTGEMFWTGHCHLVLIVLFVTIQILGFIEKLYPLEGIVKLVFW